MYILKVISKSLRGKVENVHKEQETFSYIGTFVFWIFCIARRYLIFLDSQDFKHSPKLLFFSETTRIGPIPVCGKLKRFYHRDAAMGILYRRAKPDGGAHTPTPVFSLPSGGWVCVCVCAGRIMSVAQSLASPTPSAFMANMASASGRQGES